MKLRSSENVKVRGKRVLLRVALDVHFKDEAHSDEGEGELIIEDDSRVRAIVPIVKDLVNRGAKVILLSWLQRPGGRVVESMSMRPVSKRLSELLNQDVIQLDDCVGDSVQKAIAAAPFPSVIMLENVRFHPEEKDTKVYNEAFGRELAKNADLFINNAFAQSHRKVASIVGIPKFIPCYAGPNLIREIEELSRVMEAPKRPLVAAIGGAKISTKMGVIQTLLKKVDGLVLGGALANTILLAKGIQVGTSVIEESMVETAKSLPLTDNRVHIPVDVITATEISDSVDTYTKAVANVGEKEKILDIGPDTIDLYVKVMNTAKTIIWNGPMGCFEIDTFARGTDELGRAIAHSNAYSVVGGGETVTSIKRLNLADDISFISMGGGAMLKMLEQGTIVGLEPLIKK